MSSQQSSPASSDPARRDLGLADGPTGLSFLCVGSGADSTRDRIGRSWRRILLWRWLVEQSRRRRGCCLLNQLPRMATDVPLDLIEMLTLFLQRFAVELLRLVIATVLAKHEQTDRVAYAAWGIGDGVHQRPHYAECSSFNRRTGIVPQDPRHESEEGVRQRLARAHRDEKQSVLLYLRLKIDASKLDKFVLVFAGLSREQALSNQGAEKVRSWIIIRPVSAISAKKSQAMYGICTALARPTSPRTARQ
jgi:hypothetical protein